MFEKRHFTQTRNMQLISSNEINKKNHSNNKKLYDWKSFVCSNFRMIINES